MFWTEAGDNADRPTTEPPIELAGTAGPDETEGRLIGLPHYATGLTETLQETNDIAGPEAALAAIAEWQEWVDAAQRSRENDDRATTANQSIIDALERIPNPHAHDSSHAQLVWQFYAPLAAVAGLTSAANHHLDALSTGTTQERKCHALALEVTMANLCVRQQELPDRPYQQLPGSSIRTRRLLNYVRRQSEASLERFVNAATERLNALGISLTPSIRDNPSITETAHQTAVEMLGLDHEIAVYRTAEAGDDTIVIYWHDAAIHAKRADEPYPLGCHPDIAELHGVTMLALSANVSGDGPQLSMKERSRIASEGVLTISRAQHGLHDIDQTRLEQVIRIIETAIDYNEERSQVLRRLAGDDLVLYGWLMTNAGPRYSNVTPQQAAVMLDAGRQALVPQQLLRQLARRMGQDDALTPNVHRPTGTDVEQAMTAAKSISQSQRLAEATARAIANHSA